MIEGAAAGEAAARDEFARHYLPVVRAYLGARWRGSPLLGDVEDAAQEVFVDCFRSDGALERVEPRRPGGFRAFLYGVARYVALRFERKDARRRVRPAESSFDADLLEADDPALSQVFDRAWAASILRQAAAHQRARAEDEAALRRVELLQLRFEQGLPIRDIARRWDADPARLHHEYATARKEFRTALREVVAFHHPAAAGESLDAECLRLLQLFG